MSDLMDSPSDKLMETTSERLFSGQGVSPSTSDNFAEELRFDDWNPQISTTLDIKSDDLKRYEDRLMDYSAEINFLLEKGTASGGRIDDEVSPSILAKEIFKTSNGARVASLFDPQLQEKIPDFSDNQTAAIYLISGNLDNVLTASDIIKAMIRNYSIEDTHKTLSDMGLLPKEETKIYPLLDMEKTYRIYGGSLDF